MENIWQLITEVIIWKYVGLVLIFGAWLSRDGILKPLKAEWRLILLKVDKFWRVAFLSAILALVYWKVVADADMMNLIISFAFANVFYEMGIKKLIPEEKKGV